MLKAFTCLLLFQLAGEITVRALGIPIPGPVLGMLLLFLMLLFRGHAADELRASAARILEHLSLLFVPAGVGIMVHFQRVSAELLPIAAALVVSTPVAIAATALTFSYLTRGKSAAESPPR